MEAMLRNPRRNRAALQSYAKQGRDSLLLSLHSSECQVEKNLQQNVALLVWTAAGDSQRAARSPLPALFSPRQSPAPHDAVARTKVAGVPKTFTQWSTLSSLSWSWTAKLQRPVTTVKTRDTHKWHSFITKAPDGEDTQHKFWTKPDDRLALSWYAGRNLNSLFRRSCSNSKFLDATTGLSHPGGLGAACRSMCHRQIQVPSGWILAKVARVARLR